MIGRLRGTLIDKRPPEILVECHGVGYEVLVPLSALALLPETGREIVLHTHFVQREDAQLLFGFVAREERELFRELIKVSGVGPKLGLAVLSGFTINEFLQALQEGNAARLAKTPGIGKKTAERLIVELRDRLAEWGSASGLPVLNPVVAPVSAAGRSTAEAVGALVSLGYKPQEASKAIAAVDDGEKSAEELIRLALRQMAK
jgi:Holliday junction DNA helicase RuvA